MATTGTYAFLPSTGELVLQAYARVQIRRAEIVTEHLANAKNEANLLQVAWANLGPTLWTVDTQSTPLTQGTATYNVDPSTVMILDAWISTPDGTGGTQDRIVTPLSRTEYASMPEKALQGSPTSFWFDRTDAPTITMWPVPDENGPYTLNYYRFTQSQDASLAGGLNLQIPYLWLDAFVAGLAARLAMIYKPELYAALETTAQKAYMNAANQGVENVAYYVQPQTSGYWG